MDEVSNGRSHYPRARVQIDGEFFHLGFHVHPGLDVGDVESVAQGLDVAAQQGVLRAEDSVHPGTHLQASWKEEREICRESN